jgi:hypothetical protein
MEFADAFGWTYDQVEAQPVWYVKRVLGAWKILQDLRDEKRREAQGG